MAEIVTGVPGLMRRLEAISPKISGPKMMETLGLRVVREAKLLVHRKTGNLGRSIHIAQVTNTRVTVIASAQYAAYVELGTRGGTVIVPVRKKALAWAATAAGARLTGTPRKATRRGGNGGMVFARRVIRGSTAPYPYMIPGARAALAKGGLSEGIISRWNAAD